MISNDIISARNDLALQFKMIRLRAERARDLANMAIATANSRIAEMNDELRQYNNLCGDAGAFTRTASDKIQPPANDVTEATIEAFEQLRDEWKMAEFTRLDPIPEIEPVESPIFDGEEILQQLSTEPDL